MVEAVNRGLGRRVLGDQRCQARIKHGWPSTEDAMPQGAEALKTQGWPPCQRAAPPGRKATPGGEVPSRSRGRGLCAAGHHHQFMKSTFEHRGEPVIDVPLGFSSPSVSSRCATPRVVQRKERHRPGGVRRRGPMRPPPRKEDDQEGRKNFERTKTAAGGRGAGRARRGAETGSCSPARLPNWNGGVHYPRPVSARSPTAAHSPKGLPRG